MKDFNLDKIRKLQTELNQHQVYHLVNNIDSLKIFMNHHVYSVWDFMSLLKAVQHAVAPSGSPWGIREKAHLRRFINTIVLEEESDTGLPDASGKEIFLSHFEMYCQAMQEVGADHNSPLLFANRVIHKGFTRAFELSDIPSPAKKFIKSTMEFISTGKPHVIAAAFAFGRETIIPGMFRELLEKMTIEKSIAPYFYYYLERHIHLDEDFHAPLAMEVLMEFCENDPRKILEAQNAAEQAIHSRLLFWDGVAQEIKNPKMALAS